MYSNHPIKTIKSHGHDCAVDCALNLYELIGSFTITNISTYISFLLPRIEKSTGIIVQHYDCPDLRILN